ncbi:MAG: helix-turn-helix domain-containing protein [Porcipelethomonas sp.]
MTFGEFLKQKRLEKEITLRGFAKLIDISPVYLCDLEKGRKAAPSMEVMQRMVRQLALDKEEIERFYDLAALEQTAKNPVPKDLNEFLKDNRVIVSALRTAKDLDATDEEWQEFIEKLKKSREENKNE